jgi:hypothetical protein
MARAEYLLGKIALFDSNYLEATNFALKAQVSKWASYQPRIAFFQFYSKIQLLWF